MRPGAAASGAVTMLRLSSRHIAALQVPPGVAHGVYTEAGGSITYGMTHHWDSDDDMDCGWDDPELGMAFPGAVPVLSRRDPDAGSFSDMVRGYERRRQRQQGPPA